MAENELDAALQDILDKADRTRKNAVKQFRTTATKLRNQTADEAGPVRDAALHIADNLNALADFMNELAVDQDTPVVPEAQAAPAAAAQNGAGSLPPAQPRSAQPEAAALVADDEVQGALIVSFAAGAALALLIGRLLRL